VSDEPKIVYGHDDPRYHKMRVNQGTGTPGPVVVERVSTVASQRATVAAFLRDAEQEAVQNRKQAQLDADSAAYDAALTQTGAIFRLRDSLARWPGAGSEGRTE
jgi:hypothetical protein